MEEEIMKLITRKNVEKYSSKISHIKFESENTTIESEIKNLVAIREYIKYIGNNDNKIAIKKM